MVPDDAGLRTLLLTGVCLVGAGVVHEFSRLHPLRRDRLIFRPRPAPLRRMLGGDCPAALLLLLMVFPACVAALAELLMRDGRGGEGAVLQGAALLSVLWCLLCIMRARYGISLVRVLLSLLAGLLLARLLWLVMLFVPAGDITRLLLQGIS